MDYKYFIEDVKSNIKIDDTPVVIKLDVENSDVDTENILDDLDTRNKSMIELVPEIDNNISNISNVAVAGSYYYSPNDDNNYQDDLNNSDDTDNSSSSSSSIHIKIVDYYSSSPLSQEYQESQESPELSSSSDTLNTSDYIEQTLKKTIAQKCSPNNLSPDQDNYIITQHNPLHDIFKSYIYDQDQDSD